MFTALLIFFVALNEACNALSIKEIKEIIGTNLGYDQSKMELFSRDAFDNKNKIQKKSKSIPYLDTDEIHSKNGVRFLYLMKGGRKDGDINLPGARDIYKSKAIAHRFVYPQEDAIVDDHTEIRMDMPLDFGVEQELQFISAIAQFIGIHKDSHPSHLSFGKPRKNGLIIVDKKQKNQVQRLRDEKGAISIVVQHYYAKEIWSFPIYRPADEISSSPPKINVLFIILGILMVTGLAM